MTRITGYQLKDGKLVPIKRRYDASTELKRKSREKAVRPASRKRADSVKKVET